MRAPKRTSSTTTIAAGSIPISEIDCVTGIIFGRRAVLAGLGFVGDYLDIDLYHRVTTSALR